MTSPRPCPVWRSMLFVPTNVEKFVEKAPGVGADAVILDLEDAVAANAKDEARKLLPGVAKHLADQGLDVTVRINRPWRLAVKDIEAAVSEHVVALLLPMTDSAAHVKEVDKVVTEVEAEKGLPVGQTFLCPLIETAEGYLNARDIANASPRMMSLSLGSEDFALSMGMEADPETLYAPKQHIVACARAAGLTPMGFIGSIAEFRDMDKLYEIMRRSKRAGFRCASCIHPNQVKVCNEVFGPSEDEIAQARKIVEAYDAALARGEGAITVDGIMVDVPVADRARATLALAEAIAARSKN
ncbi:MAG TPA: CoA ester lyase [Alphaproteobacteria bacterium]|nr:CoA ester lyase [Alphaproteobacteria bacterium]